MPTPTLRRLTATKVLGLIMDDKISVVTYARDLLGGMDERDGTVTAWAYPLSLLRLVNAILCSPLLRSRVRIEQSECS
jgi:hypothetical protein